MTNEPEPNTRAGEAQARQLATALMSVERFTADGDFHPDYLAMLTLPLPQPSELVELVGCISKTAWLLRLNLEDGDKRMAIENSNTMLSLIERGTAPDDLPSARTLHAEIAACIPRQEGLGGDSLVCSLGSYLATHITQLEAQIAKLQVDGDKMAGALEAFQRHYDLNDCDERCGALEVPISDLRRACQALTEWKDRA